ncbi:peroxidase P7 [Physcomitrium patens]|uniref:Peroxidase n=1 Tax=Physcomitrium patens TaxID=3218 RepID=A9T8N0_PHYPA|nr:peroxidase P7-like [Physcomitrium patens]|eukprot:XP_024381827.1 peroxidase P7-like [Physcomitrella patens]
MARIRFQQTLIVLLSLAAFFRVGDAGCPIASLGRRSLKQAPVPAQPALIFGFYDLTCPTLNSIIDTRMRFWVLQDIRTPGKVLRLFFHDCFAAGCEASILLNSTAEFAAEKDAPISVTLDKFQVIEDIKSEVETACPGIVSCADILALAAAKAVELAGGPILVTETGRRDGVVSYLAGATASMPLSTQKIPDLEAMFVQAGLDINDLVILSGAHTIGEVHCSNFADRFDPAANSPFGDVSFGQELLAFCTRNGAGDIATLNLKTFMDLQTPNSFDISYYVNLIIGRGVMTSDQVLFNDLRTQPMVREFAANRTLFFESFQASMLKMGRLHVLTGTNGVIRKQCGVYP